MLRLSDIVIDENQFMLKRKLDGIRYYRGLSTEECRELWRAIETLRLVVEGELGREE